MLHKLFGIDRLRNNILGCLISFSGLLMIPFAVPSGLSSPMHEHA